MEKSELLENVMRAMLASGVLESELLRAVHVVLTRPSFAVSAKLNEVVVSLMDAENEEDSFPQVDLSCHLCRHNPCECDKLMRRLKSGK